MNTHKLYPETTAQQVIIGNSTLQEMLGRANGLATLNADGKVPEDLLPSLSGFNEYDNSKSGLPADSLLGAIDEVVAIVVKDEKVTAAALTDLNNKTTKHDLKLNKINNNILTINSTLSTLPQTILDNYEATNAATDLKLTTVESNLMKAIDDKSTQWYEFNDIYDIENTKFSANANNNKYTVGLGSAIFDGTPTILYASVVCIKNAKLLWTHGLFYGGSSYVEFDKGTMLNRLFNE